MTIEIRPFQAEDEMTVVRLWHDCGLLVRDNDPYKDIQRKKHEHPELFLVAVEDGKVVGAVMGGYDGHRGAVNYLAVAPGRRHQGIGKKLMGTLEEKMTALGCPKMNLFIRVTNQEVVAFYEKLGFAQNTVGISFGKRLVNDDFDLEKLQKGGRPGGSAEQVIKQKDQTDCN